MQCQSPAVIGSEVNRFILSCRLVVKPLPEVSQEYDSDDYDDQTTKQAQDEFQRGPSLSWSLKPHRMKLANNLINLGIQPFGLCPVAFPINSMT
jgi:hypothetical protein